MWGEESTAAEVDSLMALWDELEGDLEEIDDLGGGDDDTVDRIDELLPNSVRYRTSGFGGPGWEFRPIYWIGTFF